VVNPREWIEVVGRFPAYGLVSFPERLGTAMVADRGHEELVDGPLVYTPSGQFCERERVDEELGLAVAGTIKEGQHLPHMTVGEWRSPQRLVLKPEVEFSDIVNGRQHPEACNLGSGQIGEASETYEPLAEEGLPQEPRETYRHVCAVVNEGMPCDDPAVVCPPEFPPKVCWLPAHKKIHAIGTGAAKQ